MIVACCCVPTCVDSGSEVLADFTQVSGSWATVGSTIETTSSNALLVHNTAHPDGVSTGTVGIYLSTIPTGGKVRIILAYTDANNYLFIELDIVGTAFGYAKFDCYIGHRTGGADTILGGSGQFNYPNQRFDICYNGAKLGGTAIASGGSGFGIEAFLTGTWGTKAAIQAIGITGTLAFNVFEFHNYNGTGCSGCRPACAVCSVTDETNIPFTPHEATVHFSGVANDNCSSCVTLFDNATFLVENSLDETSPGDPGTTPNWATRSCQFKLFDTTGGCFSIPGYDSLTLKYGIGVSSSVNTEVYINNDGRFFWGTRTANRCDEVLVETNAGGGNVAPGTQQCDWSAATVTVTPNLVL